MTFKKENELLEETDHLSLSLQFHYEHLGNQPDVNDVGMQ